MTHTITKPWRSQRVASQPSRLLATLLATALAGCSFSLADHPASCKTTADCKSTQYCYQSLCVTGAGSLRLDASTPDASGDGGAAVNAGKGGTGAGSSAAGASGGGIGAAATGGTTASQPDSGPLDASGLADTDAAIGTDAGPVVAPYAACTANGDCNPGETCRKVTSGSACAAPCTMNTDCFAPAGTYKAVATCSDDQLCRINCAPAGVPPFDRSCPAGMGCAADALLGTRSCYTK